MRLPVRLGGGSLLVPWVNHCFVIPSKILLWSGPSATPQLSAAVIGPIHEAARGDLIQLQRLLAVDPSLVNEGDWAGWTPLVHATFKDRVDIMNCLLSKPMIDINKLSGYHSTAVFYASCLPHRGALQLLLTSGADPTIRSADGLNCLMAAAQCARGGDMVRDILSMSKVPLDVNERGPKGNTALYLACREGRWSNVQVLLEKGADWTLADDNGLTPLDIAMIKAKDESFNKREGCHKCVELLEVSYLYGFSLVRYTGMHHMC